MTTKAPTPIDRVIDQALADQRLVGMVVMVAQDGRPLYSRAAGLADREAVVPMREDAVFRLASITKPFVSAAVMRLVETGVLALDAPVTRWLPEFRPRLVDGSEPTITIARLLSHTAGLGYALQEAGGLYQRLGISDGLDLVDFDLAENLRRLAEAPLFYAPGTSWRYSLALDVLGAVVAAATGKTLAAALRALVSDPLGLVDTDFTVADPTRLVTPYADGQPAPVRMTDGMAVPLWEGHVTFTPSRIHHPEAYQSGGAGLAGTAGDVLRFLEAIRTGGTPILAADTVAAMLRDQIDPAVETRGPGWGFGYGWAVLRDPVTAGVPQSRGTIAWGGVYGHSWFVDPAKGLSVVALTNGAFEGMNGPFTQQLTAAVYEAIGAR